MKSVAEAAIIGSPFVWIMIINILLLINKKSSFLEGKKAFNLKLILPVPIRNKVLPQIGLYAAATCN